MAAEAGGAVKAFVVRLDRRSGSFTGLTEAMAGKGVNLTAINAVPGPRLSFVAFLADQEDGAREALAQAGYEAREYDVIEMALANEPGALARAARALEAAGTPIEMLLTLRATRGHVVDLIAVSDPAQAELILRGLPADGVLE